MDSLIPMAVQSGRFPRLYSHAARLVRSRCCFPRCSGCARENGDASHKLTEVLKEFGPRTIGQSPGRKRRFGADEALGELRLLYPSQVLRVIWCVR